MNQPRIPPRIWDRYCKKTGCAFIKKWPSNRKTAKHRQPGIELNQRPFTYISNALAKKLVSFDDGIRIAEETLLDHFNGEITWSAPRLTFLEPDECSTSYKFKGCSNKRLGIAGFRLFSDNRTPQAIKIAGSRPTKHVLLSDYSTGEVFGIVDEHWSHALRTGSCAAVAAKHLMLPDSSEAAVVGTGYMAYCCIHALSRVMPLRKLRLWSRDRGRLLEFAERIRRELAIEVETSETPEECVRGIKVVITVTNAPEPFMKKEWFSPGVFIYAMGNHQEVDLETYLSMTFIADEKQQVKVCPDISHLISTGDFSEKHIQADLGEVVASPQPIRKHSEEQIIVRSQGLATQDIALAYWIYKKAVREGMGANLEPHLAEQAEWSLY